MLPADVPSFLFLSLPLAAASAQRTPCSLGPAPFLLSYTNCPRPVLPPSVHCPLPPLPASPQTLFQRPTHRPQAHYHTILRLKSFFPFSLIDAMGTLEEARQQIMRELRYQSSLDLDEATYAAIRWVGVFIYRGRRVGYMCGWGVGGGSQWRE